MRISTLALILVLLAPLALAHGGPHVVRYVAGSHTPGTAEPAACIATPVRLYNVVQHVGGACELEVGHPDRTSVTASADDMADAPFFYRFVDGNGSACLQGEFVGSVSVAAPLDCLHISVYAPLGSSGGTITVYG